MRKKYLVSGGYERPKKVTYSRELLGFRYITPEQVAAYFKLDPRECVFLDNRPVPRLPYYCKLVTWPEGLKYPEEPSASANEEEQTA